MYFRNRFSSFQEFQREGSWDRGGARAELGKEELELLDELMADDDALYKPRRKRQFWE